MSNDDIPQHQKAVFQCPDCRDSVWEVVNAVKFVYDRLNPLDMKPTPVPMFQCLSCRGYLTTDSTGKFVVVHKEAHLDGDEWKRGGE